MDASAIVAILTREEDADGLTDALERASLAVTSPIAVFEAVAAICRKRFASVEEVQEDIRQFLQTAHVSVQPISAAELDQALLAFSRYGKGRGHPAQLNMGDCFAYAVAKSNDWPMLFTGEDFPKTDIRAARVS